MPIDKKPLNNPLDNPMPDAIRVSLIVTQILEELGITYSHMNKPYKPR
jgi:hypothetical protein